MYLAPQLLQLIPGLKMKRYSTKGGLLQEIRYKKKALTSFDIRAIKFGGDILSRFDPVPSAQAGLTTLFGMGRGGPRRYSHQKVLNILVFL